MYVRRNFNSHNILPWCFCAFRKSKCSVAVYSQSHPHWHNMTATILAAALLSCSYSQSLCPGQSNLSMSYICLQFLRRTTWRHYELADDATDGWHANTCALLSQIGSSSRNRIAVRHNSAQTCPALPSNHFASITPAVCVCSTETWC